jgi:hypothetical protein
MPTRIKGGAPLEALNLNAGSVVAGLVLVAALLVPARLVPARPLPAKDHSVTARSVLARALSKRSRPALRMSSEHAARMKVAASSSRDALSINQNDGKAKNTATTRETAKEKMRSPKRKFAEPGLDFRAPRFRQCHPNTTSDDNGQYSMTKNARETRTPRAANITAVLPS